MKRSELSAMPQVNSWFSPLLFLVTMPAMCIAAAVVYSDMASAPRPYCQHKCGNVPIPYPFGIGDNCSEPGFNHIPITCNYSFQPPRPYMRGVEIISITIETAEMRIYAPVLYVCFTSINQSEGLISWSFNFSSTPFLVSHMQNKFTALGCHTAAMLLGQDNGTYNAGCMTYCASASASEVKVDDGKCIGLGCCKTSIANDLSYVGVDWMYGTNMYNAAWEYSPCSYAFVAEKGWHDFNWQDVVGNKTFAKRNGGRGVPLVVDWAIRNNGTCHPGDGENACVSAHSNCFNATNGQGYFCNCSKGYSGNPYVPDGCKNINECELWKSNPERYEKQYPCQSGSICHDTEGGYECKCNFWLRGDGKADKGCQPIFPAPAIATVATLCAIVLLVVLWFVHRERKTRARQRREFFDRNGGRILKSLNINLISKAQLDKITNNYSTSIGNGNFGEVFSGTNDDNQQVAVKKLKRSVKVDEEPRGKEYFVDEIIIQSQIIHPNLVRLLGCCLETEVPMLVVEFVPNGSLFDALHARGAARRSTLPLPARLDIAIGTAEALAYMHSERDGRKILHGDIKSGNILLDDNFQPKVSDFGLSKLLSSTDKKYASFVAGDRGYMDPVYMQTGILTEKSDVYSFGIVLLELITGKVARYNGNNSLPLDFKKSYETRMNRAREMLDETFTSAADTDCLEKVGAIAVHCLKEDVDERPTMAQVVDDLKLVKMKMQKLAAEMKHA